ncbi:MAG: hypothetical protein A2X22_12080 [Bacteroidetes bacterium GWF2_49_14]|nr:MAG: hypothetical protein A2X22_12080 [Bacteroidetes bacterium GWF2_49_14]HBB92338.1 hypothetical protein [Bacteroidales bacterium]
MSDALRTGINLILGAGIAIGTFSCEEDFNPNTEADPIPVVYAVIDPDDSIYCIRLTKTFHCNSSIQDCAKVPRIQYFENPVVELELLTPQEYLLNRVTLEPMILGNKEPGLFAQEPNLVYGISREHFEFEDDETEYIFSLHLILKIKAYEGAPLTYSHVMVRNPAKFEYPRKDYPQTFGLFEQKMEEISWWGYPDEFQNVIFRIGYSDNFYDSISYKHFDAVFEISPLNPEQPYFNRMEYDIAGEDFLRKMRIWFRDKPEPFDLEYRKIVSVSIVILSINDDYREYIAALNHDSDFDIKEASNIINGIGLFAIKREAISAGHSFNQKTLDSIAGSQVTRHLKFVKW